MLFTDADFVTLADITQVDGQVASVASAENIVVTGTQSIVSAACQEIGYRILNKQMGFSGYLPPFVAPYSQTAAALNLLGPSVSRPRVSLSQIVVTTSYQMMWTPIKRAAVYQSLYLFYRDAFFRKLVDRYEKRMLMYRDEVEKRYWPDLMVQGTPVVNKPMSCPGAVYEPASGAWNAAGNLAAVAGTNAAGTTSFDVAVTWVDQSLYVSPTVKGNGESGPSARATISAPTANVIQVSVASLNAPNGGGVNTTAQGMGLFTPLTATGWNVYVGTVGGTLYLQNATPIAYANKTYTMAGAPVLSGVIADQGQNYVSSFTMQNQVFRG